jgi:hypothetical protein
MASHRRDLATSGTTLTTGRTTVLVDTTAWPAFPSGQDRADVNARGLAHAPLPPGPHALPPLEPAPPQA